LAGQMTDQIGRQVPKALVFKPENFKQALKLLNIFYFSPKSSINLSEESLAGGV